MHAIAQMEKESCLKKISELIIQRAAVRQQRCEDLKWTEAGHTPYRIKEIWKKADQSCGCFIQME